MVMSRQRSRRSVGRPSGLTVLELLIVIAIILTLMGIVWCTFGPARERGRRLVCVSNLKQIYAAIQMYREDNGGDDLDEGVPMTAWQMGLPMNLGRVLGPARVGPDGVFQPPRLWKGCPNDHNPPNMGSYGYAAAWTPQEVIKGEQRPCHRCPTFSEVVARRGGETVIVYDTYHACRSDPQNFVIVLRLSGQVDPRSLPWDMGDSWDW